MKKHEGLRRGFTTGTCAAAGTKAAAHALFAALSSQKIEIGIVRVTLPRGGFLDIPVKSVEARGGHSRAVIVKDAGDDPDVTNGAEFVVDLVLVRMNRSRPGITVRGGEGVGVVTKPGLKVAIGRPAINPVPMRMIKAAFMEAAKEAGVAASVTATVSVPAGRELARNTMNNRLGIVGGISILGTTGIVEPMSLSAYTHSISYAVDVALACGSDTVVFSTGRSSEKVVEGLLGLSPEAFVLTGDHMGFALKDSKGKPGVKSVIVAGQFGKFTKLAANHFETHCDDSSVELDFLAKLCRRCGAGPDIIKKVLDANTAREVFFLLRERGLAKVFAEIASMVRANSMAIAGAKKSVGAILVGYSNEIVCRV